MGQDVQAARVPGRLVKNEIGNEVALVKGGLEDFTGEEAPISSEG